MDGGTYFPRCDPESVSGTFFQTKRGILWAIILSGVLFGAVHLTNISQGVTVTSAMIQAINAAFLGVIFGAVYARSGNIWLVMTFHALVDFASLMGSGILELEQLWNRSTRCLPLI